VIDVEYVFKRTEGLTDKDTHYCPGCTHGIIHRLVAESIEELGMLGKAIGVAPVGCAVLAVDYFNMDMLEAAHGRAPAVATGVKRVRPDCLVFTYQGDGDLASIGIGEIVHAANRSEKITAIFVNNAVFGMTGGQMAPTSLIGQKTTTTPLGRDPSVNGYPIRVSEMLSTLDGAQFIARVSVDSPKAVRNAKKAILESFRCQMEGRGFSMVEVLSSCPTNWGMTPVEALEHLRGKMASTYPLGTYCDRRGDSLDKTK
jgi:2-oxoglutarate/2-oxoacid ferredoxin oxidoreductase subunit beta